MLALEKKRRQLLEAKEKVWILKRRTLCLQSEDENTKKIQAYAKGRKMVSTIWSLKDPTGRSVTSFEGMAQLGTRNFHNLFKTNGRVSIEAIMHLALFFLRFVDKEDNSALMDEVVEDELKEVLHSFQKDKSLSPDGWTI